MTEVTQKLTADEIVTMCEKLARKYRRPHLNEDLVSEGVLAVYERLGVSPDDYPASLYRHANTAMHSYINIRTKAVTIPATRDSEAISKGVEYESGSYSKKGKEELAKALSAKSVSFEDSYSLSVDDCTKKYETHDFITKAFKTLDATEADLIRKRYLEEMIQEDVAKEYGISQQAIFKREVSALKKMSRL